MMLTFDVEKLQRGLGLWQAVGLLSSPHHSWIWSSCWRQESAEWRKHLLKRFCQPVSLKLIFALAAARNCSDLMKLFEPCHATVHRMWWRINIV